MRERLQMLIRAMKRNIDRFPLDFAFQLTRDEFSNLRFHFGTSSWGGRKYLPYAFTEHGAIMAAGILNSERAVQASIYVVRAFVRLRQLLTTHKELAQKLIELEQKLQGHDKQIRVLVEAIRQLMLPPEAKPKRPFGFHSKGQKNSK